MENNFDLRFRFEDTDDSSFCQQKPYSCMYCSLILFTTLLTSLFYMVGGANLVPKVSSYYIHVVVFTFRWAH